MRNRVRSKLLAGGWTGAKPESKSGAGLHEPLDAELPPMPSERSTGLVFAVVAVIAAAVFRTDTTVATAAIAAAAAFATVALAAPHWLAPLNRAWFALALLLNRVVSPVVMFVLFAGLIVPAGLAMQMRRDPLRVRRDRSRGTYWITRAPDAPSSSMRDQF